MLLPNLPGILPEIQNFLGELLAKAGLEKAVPEIKAMMLSDLSERLSSQLMLTFAKHLNEKDLNTFSRLAAVDGAQAAAFVKDVCPEMPKYIGEALEEFAQVFLEEKK